MAKEFNCEYCDGKVEPRVIRAPFHFGRQTIYVDHVPAWVCKKCGEKYYDASVVKRLEQIARRRRRISKTVSFPLAEYDRALP